MATWRVSNSNEVRPANSPSHGGYRAPSGQVDLSMARAGVRKAGASGRNRRSTARRALAGWASKAVLLLGAIACLGLGWILSIATDRLAPSLCSACLGMSLALAALAALLALAVLCMPGGAGIASLLSRARQAIEKDVRENREANERAGNIPPPFL